VALEAGVKCKAAVVCVHEPRRERGGFGVSHLAYEIGKWKAVWTVIRNRSGLVVDEQTDLSWEVFDDVIVAEVRRRVEKLTSIFNVCD
jgi:hypothetical protein